jgi:hypothetical protein
LRHSSCDHWPAGAAWIRTEEEEAEEAEAAEEEEEEGELELLASHTIAFVMNEKELSCMESFEFGAMVWLNHRSAERTIPHMYPISQLCIALWRSTGDFSHNGPTPVNIVFFSRTSQSQSAKRDESTFSALYNVLSSWRRSRKRFSSRPLPAAWNHKIGRDRRRRQSQSLASQVTTYQRPTPF